MAQPTRALAAPGLDLSDFAQEIEEPLVDVFNRRDEPTMTRIDFDELELELDFLPR